MEAPPLERKLVAILAADVASYSRTDGDRRGRNIGDLIGFSPGHRSASSRATREEFAGPRATAFWPRSAAHWRRSNARSTSRMKLAQSNNELEKNRRMQFRIGINVGDVMLKDGDIFGDGVNIAARLEGLADPGGICISRGIHDHVMKKLPFEFEDLGEQSVKNIAQPVRVYRLLLDERASKLAIELRCAAVIRCRGRYSLGFRQRAERAGFRPAGGGNRVLGLNQEQHSGQRIRGLSRAIP